MRKRIVFAGLLVVIGMSISLVAVYESLHAAQKPQAGASDTIAVPVAQAVRTEKPKNINTILKQAADDKSTALWYLLLLAFIAGIFISFTPCVYPMIPITIGVLRAQGGRSLLYNIASATSYVVGIAVVYAALGYFSATAGVLFGRWVASPWVTTLAVLFFMYMAFSLFGFYSLYIPSFLQRRADVQATGSLAKTFLFGMVSGSVASPCLTPALAVLLAIVAKIGNPVSGLLMLFFFALGMGALLIVIGIFSGSLSLLPQAGVWMVEIERAMGFMLLGACVYFVQPLVGYQFAVLLYGFVLMTAGSYFVQQRAKSSLMLIVGGLLGLSAVALFGLYFCKSCLK